MDVNQIYSEYRTHFKSLVDCTSRLHMYVYKNLLKEYEGETPIISSRTKSVQSLAYNIEQEQIPPSSILESRDLIGLRIICISETRVSEIVEFVQKILSIQDIKNTQTRLGEDKFGYSSIHLLGNLADNSTKIQTDESEAFENFWFEIQVRTFAQHIFAELSHKYSYKSGKFIPSEIRRHIYRIAALSEVIDNNITMFEEERIKYITAYQPNAQEEINIENLKLFFASKLDSFRDAGPKEDYEGILRDLAYFGVKRISDLEKLLDKHWDKFRMTEIRSLEVLKSEISSEDELIRQLIINNYIYSYTGTTRGILNQEFKTAYVEYKRDVIDPPMWQTIKEMVKNLK